MYLNQSQVNYDRLQGLLSQHDQSSSVAPSIYVRYYQEMSKTYISYSCDRNGKLQIDMLYKNIVMNPVV